MPSSRRVMESAALLTYPMLMPQYKRTTKRKLTKGNQYRMQWSHPNHRQSATFGPLVAHPKPPLSCWNTSAA